MKRKIITSNMVLLPEFYSYVPYPALNSPPLVRTHVPSTTSYLDYYDKDENKFPGVLLERVCDPAREYRYRVEI